MLSRVISADGAIPISKGRAFGSGAMEPRESRDFRIAAPKREPL